ncbi:methyltransferase family protein [Mangrovicella endophytica]|uniref:methyltransferase family protein n=1 Tax=Mangrovicella endophytica TaxID=2066697 RepID=UPI0012FFD99E|nr:isoprenylcysteine carboxylmethyltransferase family protein [Mangrovicella endophytica]
MLNDPLRYSLSRTQRTRKIVIRIAAGIVLPLILFADARLDHGHYLREFVETFGLLLIVFGLMGRAWCSLYIGGHKARRLVRSGPYSLSRNPLYLFSFIATAGIGAQTGSVMMMLLCLVGGWLIFRPVIDREEQALASLFPEEYGTYHLAVPRLVPSLRQWADVDRLEINPKLYRRTVLDSLAWLALVPVIQLVVLTHQTGHLPVFIHLP